MSQSKLAESEILQIRSMIENIGGKLDLLLGANPDVKKHVYDMFRGKKRLAEIYLSLDDEDDYSQTSTYDYVADHFQVSKPNIVQQLRPLKRAGIIQQVDLPSRKVLLKKSSADRIFELARFLRKEFLIDESRRRPAEPNPPVSSTEPVPQ